MKKTLTSLVCSVATPVLVFGQATRDQGTSRDGGGLTENLDIVSILIGLIIGILIGYLIWGRKK